MAVREIDVETLQRTLSGHDPVTVIDVRPAAERAEWAIPGSAHVDAYASLRAGDARILQQAARTLPRGVPVVAVCAAGQTSLLAADVLQQMGFTDVASLSGGMTAWSETWNIAEKTYPAADRLPITIVQVRRTGKGCLSYIVGNGQEAAVVDPALPAAVYLTLARERGWRIVAVLDTHVHADHVSRAYSLGMEASAPVYLPPQQRVRHPFTPLADGESIAVGGTRLRALSTPGHTHESTSYQVGDVALLTGDTLFLRGVGRPDLEASGDESARRARLLYHSIRDRVFALPDGLDILPGHASSALAFDGALHAAPLGDVRAAIALAGLPEAEFVATILDRVPACPPNHHRIVQINEGVEEAPVDLRALEAGANRCAVTT